MEKSYLEKIQIHKENKLAGLHPGAKLWVVILYTVCTFILNSIHLTEVGLSLAVIPWFLVVLILCAASGAMKKCVKAFKAVAFIALVIFVVQTFIVPGGEVLWRFGILRICEKGLRTAISLSFMVFPRLYVEMPEHYITSKRKNPVKIEGGRLRPPSSGYISGSALALQSLIVMRG